MFYSLLELAVKAFDHLICCGVASCCAGEFIPEETIQLGEQERIKLTSSVGGDRRGCAETRNPVKR